MTTDKLAISLDPERGEARASRTAATGSCGDRRRSARNSWRGSTYGAGSWDYLRCRTFPTFTAS
jgi:hypothetical protein